MAQENLMKEIPKLKNSAKFEMKNRKRSIVDKAKDWATNTIAASSVDKAKDWATNTIAASSASKLGKKRKNYANDMAIRGAKEDYRKKTGREMTPSRLMDEARGGFLSKDTRDYLKNRDSREKSYKKAMSGMKYGAN